MRRRGFTLVEILVALVVVEVGVLGVVGTLLLAARTLGRAEALEHGVTALEAAYDSLRTVPRPSDGRALVPPGEVRWWTSGEELHLVFQAADGRALARLDGWAGGVREVPR